LRSDALDADVVCEGWRAVGSLRSGPQHANPMGTLHGVLCDLSDAAMGMAFATTLAPDESFTTVSLSINFFRPVTFFWRSRLTAAYTNSNRSQSARKRLPTGS
jgi:hypothetical protein